MMELQLKFTASGGDLSYNNGDGAVFPEGISQRRKTFILVNKERMEI